MTLKGRYDKIMDRVQMTDEMRARVLEKVRQADLSAPEDRRRAPAAWRRWGAMAACLAVVIAGGLALPHLLPQNGTEDPPVMTGPGTEEMDSRAALEQAVGFSVEEAEHLPFAPQEVLYTAFDSGLVQVEYRGENGFTLALWQKDGFSYSLNLSQGQNIESWAEILCSVK